jgi:hypothetical protein
MFLILCASLLSACSSSTDSDTTYDPHVRAFKQSLVTLTANSYKVVPDAPITITTHFTPLVTGKGIIGMRGYGEYPNSSWQVESPVQKMFTPADRDSTAVFALDFTANQPIDLQWQVRLHDLSAYHILANVGLDSVFIADSGRMYSIKSDEARRITNGYGYNYIAHGDYIHFFPEIITIYSTITE